MQKIWDLHIHTKFSIDAEEDMEAYCKAAMQKGVNKLCFTEHVDYNPCDTGYEYYNAEAFFKVFYPLQEKYKGKIDLLCGIEFSEPHMYPTELAQLAKLPYDFIIGSVHYWYQNMFIATMIEKKVPLEVCYDHYWKEVLKTAQAGGFDCLGHMDFPKRYFKDVLYDQSTIEEIVKTLLKNDICIEINTSSLRNGLNETMPGNALLQIYSDCSGKYVTIGSDAHFKADLAANIDFAKKMAQRYGLQVVYFKNRKMQMV